MADYDYRMYWMPASTGMSGFGTSVCWNAMEQNRVWLPGTTWVDQYALVHELGHNLGLMHAQVRVRARPGVRGREGGGGRRRQVGGGRRHGG